MPRLPQVYSLTTAGSWIVPVVTKGRKRCLATSLNGQSVTGVAIQSSVMNGQIVTLFVSLCVYLPKPRADQLRQVTGRYFPSRVLGVHVQVMLPAWLIGDSTRYLLMSLIRALAFGP